MILSLASAASSWLSKLYRSLICLGFVQKKGLASVFWKGDCLHACTALEICDLLCKGAGVYAMRSRYCFK